jgi:hypothetical protein
MSKAKVDEIWDLPIFRKYIPTRQDPELAETNENLEQGEKERDHAGDDWIPRSEARSKEKAYDIWDVSVFRKPKVQMDIHKQKARDAGWCKNCQEPWLMNPEDRCSCGHIASPEVKYILEVWQKRESQKKMLGDLQGSIKRENGLMALNLQLWKDLELAGTNENLRQQIRKDYKEKRELFLNKLIHESEEAQNKENTMSDVITNGKKKKGLCQQCLNPGQKGICTCGTAKSDVKTIPTSPKKKANAVPEKKESKEPTNAEKLIADTFKMLNLPVPTLEEKPAEDPKVTGKIGKPEFLGFHTEKVPNGGFLVTVTGNLVQDSIRFANEKGTFVLNRGEKSSCEMLSDTSLILTVALCGCGCPKSSFKVKVGDSANIELLKAAVDAYNDWVMPQISKAMNISGVSFRDSVADGFGSESNGKVGSVSIEDASDYFYLEEGVKENKESLDKLIEQLSADFVLKQDKALKEIACVLEGTARRLREEQVRRSTTDEIINRLREWQKKDSSVK